jgi:hypothetical protein
VLADMQQHESRGHHGGAAKKCDDGATSGSGQRQTVFYMHAYECVLLISSFPDTFELVLNKTCTVFFSYSTCIMIEWSFVEETILWLATFRV